MPIPAKYVHTNLVARDWRRLARFYQEVFGCTGVPPERHFSGISFEQLTALPGAKLQGAHLRLPGYGEGGPTLEIFQYQPEGQRLPTGVNHRGYGHLAFAVEDVPSALEVVLAAGGKALGEVVTLEVAGGAKVTVVYATDPEGNILELQSWTKG